MINVLCGCIFILCGELLCCVPVLLVCVRGGAQSTLGLVVFRYVTVSVWCAIALLLCAVCVFFRSCVPCRLCSRW